MADGSGVTVLGSANLDLVLAVAVLPAAGQTLLSSGRAEGAGGKGLNQAVAAARAGAGTRFVGAVGSDAAGRDLLGVLADEGIGTLVRTTSSRTGLAVVLVDGDGENAIVVAPGANADVLDLRADELVEVVRSRVLLMQLEIPLRTVAEAARAARSAGATVVLNAAPGAPLGTDLTDHVDLLVVNEGEARMVAGSSASSGGVDDDVDRLLERVPAVVVTLGPAGALYRDRAGARHEEPGRAVPVVDTTGAGDTFAGYLAAGLADGLPVPAALRLAGAAASLCVQRRGAVPAVPHRHEVDALLGG